MQLQKNIFNKRSILSKIHKMQPILVKNYNKSLEIIRNWINIIENGRLEKTKEISIQGTFLRQFFVEILGYHDITSVNSEWNIEQELSTIIDSTKPDAVLGFFNDNNKDTRVVIELKDAKTDLDIKQKGRKNQLTPVEQAFSYAPKYGKKCNWVIVSNFKEIRIYNSSSILRYERFLVTDLINKEEFFKFYYLLNKDNLICKDGRSVIDYLYLKNEEEKRKISDSFYKDYKELREIIFKGLKQNNKGIEELILLEKAQKILDRIIFICFCQEKDLLPNDTLESIFKIYTMSYSPSTEKLWTLLKELFNSIDNGNPPMNINKFNGGLFKEDKCLNNLSIPDEILVKIKKFNDYDFDSDININILGHIFEQSITDIETLKNQIQGIKSNAGIRKKSGIYYTPEYITRYMVEQSIGQWLKNKRKKLGEDNLPVIPKEIKRMTTKRKNFIKQHLQFYEEYKKILSNIKVLDIACGSGAFLNQAFDYLYNEGQRINKAINDLKGEPNQITMFDLDKQILKQNLYGVDISWESVEITKLSLWLKTANKQSTLTSLDDNIKCGNSLIDDYNIEGNKAFIWEKEFKNIIDSGGFDVIISNPPYIDSEKMVKYFHKERDYCREKYCSAKGNWDIYVVFVEKALKLLKNDGIMTYILPNKFIGAPYTKELRKMLLEYNFLQFRDYSLVDVFKEADVYPVTFVLEKSHKKGNIIISLMKSEVEVEHINIVTSKNFYRDIYWDRYFVKNKNHTNILEKLLEYDELKSFAEIKGASTVGESYKIKKYLIEYEELKGCTAYKKFINTGTIDRYVSLWGKQKTNYIKKSYNKPVIRKKDLKKISYTRLQEANKEKIIIGGMNKRLECFYDKGDYLAGKSTTIITNTSLDMLYILGILNSNLISFFYRIYYKSLSLKGGYLPIGKTQLEKLPIAIPNKEQKKEIIELVEKTIDNYNNKRLNTKENIDYSKEIDGIVYKIFGLTKIEIEEVEKEMNNI